MAERTERRNHGSTDHLLLLSLPLLRSFSLVRSRCLDVSTALVSNLGYGLRA